MTLQGFRIISMGYKELPGVDEQGNILNIEHITNREQVEQNIQFLGLIVFENPLKEDTRNVITSLKVDGKLNLKIISGGSF